MQLKGHKRPITVVQFSPVDKLLVSCCAHGHAMVWNIVDYQCIRTLQVSPLPCLCLILNTVVTRTVLPRTSLAAQNEKGVGIYQARFLNRGLQLATTDALGMLKLWTVKTAECAATISEHSEEDSLRDVWALDITADDEYIITGGTDSRINILKDFTGEPRCLIASSPCPPPPLVLSIPH